MLHQNVVLDEVLLVLHELKNMLPILSFVFGDKCAQNFYNKRIVSTIYDVFEVLSLELFKVSHILHFEVQERLLFYQFAVESGKVVHIEAMSLEQELAVTTL